MVFNSLPREVRDFGGAGVGVNEFKGILGGYLDKIPDQLRDLVNGNMPLAVDIHSGQNLNSIVHWRGLMEKDCPEYTWH